MIDPRWFVSDETDEPQPVGLIILPDLSGWTIPEDQLLLGLAEVFPGKRWLGGLSTGRDRDDREFYMLDLLAFVRRLTMAERARVLKLTADQIAKEVMNLLIEVLKPTEMIELLELLQGDPDGDRVFGSIIAALPRDKYNAVLMEMDAASKILSALMRLFEATPGNA